MTPIPASYTIDCPDCHRRRYVNGVPCDTCQGNGQLVIPEQVKYRDKGGRRLFFAVIFLIVAVICVLAVNR
jgi:hypothetical protein